MSNLKINEMKNILNRLIQHEILNKEEAKDVLVNISSGSYNPSQIAAFMTVYMMRSITIEELAGFREALLELCIPIDFSAYNTIDLCGTGGDGKDTFNISTLASFIVAGAGIKVAKHGNYGVSSISGSSNVMEKMGVKFTNNQDFLTKSIEEYINYYAVAYPEDGIDSDTDYKRVGLFVGHELFINKLSIETQLGYYVYKPFDYEDNTYQRVGLKYYLYRNWFTGIGLKTHRGRAEAVEATLGIRL